VTAYGRVEQVVWTIAMQSWEMLIVPLVVKMDLAE
jgi:hypothetical protein